MTFPNFSDRLVVLLPRSIFIVSPEINTSNIYERECVRIAHLLKQWRNSKITILGKTSVNVLNWYCSVVILSSRDEYLKFICRTPPIEPYNNCVFCISNPKTTNFNRYRSNFMWISQQTSVCTRASQILTGLRATYLHCVTYPDGTA